ncbi:Mu transposase domain-containing protein [Oxyplasma meridianum]|uniref:Mu transposase domain-containing protein n=1 Tax=Oxyplasma meridianum TaxID=3073602 RepID=UPI00372D3175
MTRKVSRECYVWYKGNRYFFPWKYAERECTVKEDNGKILITVDSEIVDHDIPPGSSRISRKKDHFEGLLKAIRSENMEQYQQIVEKRDLKKYEEVA